MQKKKKFDLTKDMVSIEYANNPKNHTKVTKTKLTLSVDVNFIKKFKLWCVKHDITMSEALVEAFYLLQKKHEN